MTQTVKCSKSSFITFDARSESRSSFDTGFPGSYMCSIQKPIILLLHWLLVLIPQAVAWLRSYQALQERAPKRWAISCHYLTIPFGVCGYGYEPFLVKFVGSRLGYGPSRMFGIDMDHFMPILGGPAMHKWYRCLFVKFDWPNISTNPTYICCLSRLCRT